MTNKKGDCYQTKQREKTEISNFNTLKKSPIRLIFSAFVTLLLQILKMAKPL